MKGVLISVDSTAGKGGEGRKGERGGKRKEGFTSISRHPKKQLRKKGESSLSSLNTQRNKEEKRDEGMRVTDPLKPVKKKRKNKNPTNFSPNQRNEDIRGRRRRSRW